MGGVLLTLVPQSTMMLAAAGMMAPDGRCKTLDAAADGYVRAEACRMLFIQDPGTPRPEHISLRAAADRAGTSDLRPIEWSQAGNLGSEDQPGASSDPASAKLVPSDKPSGTHSRMEVADVPVAVLLGCGVNTNGRASALTAPHGPSQQALLRAVLGTAEFMAAEVAGLQLHANGTPLGDPIEVGAGAAVFQVRVVSAAALWRNSKPRRCAVARPSASPDSLFSDAQLMVILPFTPICTAASQSFRSALFRTMERCPAMQAGNTASQPFLLATAKGFTGHSEAAAGAASLTEAVLLLVQARAAPALHLRHLNPHIAGVIGVSSAGARSVAVSRAGADPVPTCACRAPSATCICCFMMPELSNPRSCGSKATSSVAC